MSDRLVLAVIGGLSAVIVAAVGYLLLGHDPGPGAPPGVASLPALNATLNATAAALLVAGWVLIRRGRVGAHRACMLGAVAVSTAFLVSYVAYHATAGSRPFAGQGWIRPVYFTILVSHIALAAAMVPFVLTTLYRALRGDFQRHARLARWTLPVWLYVSATGVVVYWLVFRVG